MRVLITNIQLNSRTGTELYVRDLATQLQIRGHEPVVFTQMPGVISDEIRRAGIRVIDDLNAAEVPDVIQGHHTMQTIGAVVRFPEVSALFVCHDAMRWHDNPPKVSSIRRWIGVDANTLERILESGVERSRTDVIQNGVDIDRFLRRDPLPTRPARALVFCNEAVRGRSLSAVRLACRRMGIALDVKGSGVGDSIDRPELVLPGYDLVFAKARCALEAMATGAAVILFDGRHIGALVTRATVSALRLGNFGAWTIAEEPTPRSVQERIADYDSDDASSVTDWIRDQASLSRMVDELERTYRDITTEVWTRDEEADRREIVRLIGWYSSKSIEWFQRSQPPSLRQLITARNIGHLGWQFGFELADRLGLVPAARWLLGRSK
jgi:hypothetical protein